jgi:integrator complex subunit 3
MSNSNVNQHFEGGNGSGLAGAGPNIGGAGGGPQSGSSSSYGVLISNLLNIITENYSKLLDVPRQQLIWLLKELVKAKVNQFDKLILQMLRNIQSGSLIDKNIWLAESMLDILYDTTLSTTSSSTTTATSASSNTDQTPSSSSSSQALWIYAHNELMMQSVYTYLRLISDHAQSPTLTQLRQRESDFCCQVLREKWNRCMLIGRDLVRLIQNLSKISEFELLWKEIISSPQSISPQFSQLGGLIYLMKLPSRRRCLISRLTVDMERKIYFIITSVKYGAQKRYQDWFQRQYLNTPESQSLRVDLIRYICVVVHPTNEQLNSGLTPRWAVCGWLINTCTSLIDSANLKLALFFDWLLYDSKRDNIMLIEPAILLMFNSMKINALSGGGSGSSGAQSLINMNSANVNVTSMLFDFLCRISTNYFWPYKEQILLGIMHSFKDSVEKRVIPSLQVFFNPSESANNTGSATTAAAAAGSKQQPALDRDLKMLLQATFGDFFQTLNVNQKISAVPVVVSTGNAGVVQQGSASTQLSSGSSSSVLMLPIMPIKSEQQQQIKPFNSDIMSNSSSFMPISQPR